MKPTFLIKLLNAACSLETFGTNIFHRNRQVIPTGVCLSLRYLFVVLWALLFLISLNGSGCVCVPHIRNLSLGSVQFLLQDANGQYPIFATFSFQKNYNINLFATANLFRAGCLWRVFSPQVRFTYTQSRVTIAFLRLVFTNDGSE